MSEIFHDGEIVTDVEPRKRIQLFCRNFVKKGSRVYKSFDKKLSREIITLDQPSKIGMEFHLVAELGQNAALRYCDEDGYQGIVTHSYIVEKAQKHPLTQQTVESQLQSLGNTLFYFRQCKLTGGDGIIVPTAC